SFPGLSRRAVAVLQNGHRHTPPTYRSCETTASMLSRASPKSMLVLSR
ncbi:MAG: hypothetical protein ACI9EF_000152, partial [Pseudohongiellaceae bacterium]